jgi:hypothetical protein
MKTWRLEDRDIRRGTIRGMGNVRRWLIRHGLVDEALALYHAHDSGRGAPPELVRWCRTRNLHYSDFCAACWLVLECRRSGLPDWGRDPLMTQGGNG